MAHICVVDDQAILRDSVAEALTREDHDVTVHEDPQQALADIKQHRFELLVTDLKMPRMDGLALMRSVRSAGFDMPVIMMTAYATIPTAVEAMKLGAFDYIQKPFDADRLTVLVERALDHARLRHDNEALRQSVDDATREKHMIGSGEVMSDLRAGLDRMADSCATVLITGESGTGKELAAAYLHRKSPRAERPMLCLNCAALSANLLESELFGHERGAFTGADRTRKGRFELADGGTLLLDEISELDMPLQAKLLRVLQEGEFERVGSSTTRRADVRVVATTNRNLQEWVEKDRFREDLYYRLNVLPLSMPALRHRSDDIIELAESFLERAARNDGNQPLTIEPAAREVLLHYSWPGNVRELENLCRRAATLCTAGTLTADLLKAWLTPQPAAAELPELRDGHMLQDMERRLIEQTLHRFGGHRAKSARALGMGVRTLGMKLKQWREEAERLRNRPETVEVG